MINSVHPLHLAFAYLPHSLVSLFCSSGPPPGFNRLVPSCPSSFNNVWQHNTFPCPTFITTRNSIFVAAAAESVSSANLGSDSDGIHNGNKGSGKGNNNNNNHNYGPDGDSSGSDPNNDIWSSNPIVSLLNQLATCYNELLHTNPLLSKCLTAAVLMPLSDFVAQILEYKSASKKAANKLNSKPFSLDAVRLFNMATIGFFLQGPLAHYWYDFLDHVTRGVLAGWRSVVIRTFINEIIYAPIYIVAFFTANQLLKGNGWQGAKTKTTKEFKKSLLANWSLWPLVHLIGFMLVPTSHRVLYINLVNIGWLTFLSLLSNRGDSLTQY